MSAARNGNRRCPNCKHFFAAHAYEAGTDRRPCTIGHKLGRELTENACRCVSLENREEAMTLSDELKPYLEAIKEKIRERGPAPHAVRVSAAAEALKLQALLYDKREKYLAETRTPAKNTILIYLEGDKGRPVRKPVLRVTTKHIVVAWHDPRCLEHHFSRDSGYSLERPSENGRRGPHSIDQRELAELQQVQAALQG